MKNTAAIFTLFISLNFFTACNWDCPPKHSYHEFSPKITRTNNGHVPALENPLQRKDTTTITRINIIPPQVAIVKKKVRKLRNVTYIQKSPVYEDIIISNTDCDCVPEYKVHFETK